MTAHSARRNRRHWHSAREALNPRGGEPKFFFFFWEGVASLVDCVSKLTASWIQYQVEKQAHSKNGHGHGMDIRSFLVKLADRLPHDAPLRCHASHKKRRIARETLDIYAPFANRREACTRLGWFRISRFKSITPMRLGMLQYGLIHKNIGQQGIKPQKLEDTSI